MPRQRRDLIEDILKARATVFQAISAVTIPVWIDLDLTMSQMKGLRTLAHHNPATVTRFADALKISQPTASQLVDRLVQAGLAERSEDPDDRRRMLVRLSKKGQQLHERLSQGHQQFRLWLQQMSSEDLDALHRGFGALALVASIEDSNGALGRSPRRAAPERGR
jgi:DNA-binding MarR family transcriptional regulator